MTTTEQTINHASKVEIAKPRLFIEEGQEFVIGDNIYVFKYQDSVLKNAVIITRTGVLPPSEFTVSVVENKTKKRRK